MADTTVKPWWNAQTMQAKHWNAEYNANYPLPWPEYYFHGYIGPREYRGPNGVLGPWVLPAGFSYTGEVKRALDREHDAGTWYITHSRSHGPFKPCLVAPVKYDRPYDYLKKRQRIEGHKNGLYSWGVPVNENLDVWILNHENTSAMTWLETQLKIMTSKLVA